MKYKILLMSFLILMSCQDQKRKSSPDYENMDLVSLKKLMNEKMAEQTQLTHQIDSIQQRIEELDPSADNKRMSRVDRKSTRLNSSHVAISYAVFCLKKK